MSNYYKNEIARITSDAQIKVMDENGNETKWININKESAMALIDWLSSKLSLYKQVLHRGIEFDTHCNDLYLYVTDETIKLIDGYEYKNNVTTFKNEINGRLMFDVPFAYEDYRR